MRKATSKRQRAENEISSEPAVGEPVDLPALRQQIRNLVGNQAVSMVVTTMEQVKQGHYQALKYLFEMIGLYPATTTQEEPTDDSLAKLLLSHLGLPLATPGLADENCPSSQVVKEADAVK